MCFKLCLLYSYDQNWCCFCFVLVCNKQYCVQKYFIQTAFRLWFKVLCIILTLEMQNTHMSVYGYAFAYYVQSTGFVQGYCYCFVRLNVEDAISVSH